MAKLADIIAMPIGLVGVALLILGFGLPVYQSYLWLKLGAWPAISLATLLRQVDCPPLSGWAARPSDWLGVHAILEFLPAALMALAAGAIVLWGAEAVHTKLTRRP